MNRNIILAPVLLLPLVLAACNAAEAVPDSSYNDERWKGNNRAFVSAGFGLAPGKNNGMANETPASAINPYLWRGALDSLATVPLAAIDAKGGVIVADWTNSGPTERTKSTVYVNGNQLSPDGLRVTVFRQVLKGGQWTDLPADPAAAAALQGRILARAQELRGSSAG